jgi:hypothetical protein
MANEPLSDYTANSTTTNVSSAPEPQTPASLDVKVEIQKYGLAKPKRIVIRGKVSHGGD